MFTEGMDPKLAQIVGGLYGLLTDTPKEREQAMAKEAQHYVLVSDLRVGDRVVLYEGSGGVHTIRAIEEYGDGDKLTLNFRAGSTSTANLYKKMMVEVLTPTEV